MTNTITVSRELLQQTEMLCQWINETPHQRGSINGQAAQVGYALRAAMEQPRQERACWTCRYEHQNENVPCMKCGGFNKWEPKQ